MRYAVFTSSAAQRDLKRIHGAILRRIAGAIDALADDPRPPGMKKLAGAADLFRIRVGDYRIVYQIDDPRQSELVLRVRHRSDVYRR